MHVGHEFVKMHTAFADHGTGLEEEIHQHRLATTNFPVDIQTFQGSADPLTLPEQPTE